MKTILILVKFNQRVIAISFWRFLIESRFY
nr:MAG TPA: hypothetical protein [Caudoviricetes sp.]